jgi:hypothetical protein
MDHEENTAFFKEACLLIRCLTMDVLLSRAFSSSRMCSSIRCLAMGIHVTLRDLNTTAVIVKALKSRIRGGCVTYKTGFVFDDRIFWIFIKLVTAFQKSLSWTGHSDF